MAGNTLTPDQRKKLASKLGKEARSKSPGATVAVGNKIDDQGNVKTITVTFKEKEIAPSPKRGGK